MASGWPHYGRESPRTLKLRWPYVDKAEVDDLTKEFLAESREGLDRMEQCLTELDRRPGDAELIAEIFRAVHTIKGATGFLGFGRLEALAHTGENLLGSVRAGTLAVTEELIGGLLALLDGLRAILRLIETTGGEGQRTTDEDFELIGQLIGLSAGKAELANCLVCTVANAKGAALGGGSEPAGEHAGRAESADLPEMAAAADRELAADNAERRVVTQAAEKTVRVDVDVLNRMMNLVGELVLTRNRILQIEPVAGDLTELARRLDGLTTELRETVMQARMQPVGHLFGKFPRMVRDLAQVCGRRVRIEFEGEHAGLDKSLLEAVRDPLTHAVRNAVDHGIESPEARLAAGKNPEGVLRLRAFHRKGCVAIEVIDDGAGIAVERVRAKAVERGVVTAEEAAGFSEREVLQLVFAAGFSTAPEVTSVSGRGVGLDVVRSNLERVGGSVELDSVVGLGTTLRLNVPLTMAIVPSLVVRSGEQSFAIPRRVLHELVYVPEREIATAIERIGRAEVYRQRGHLLPLLRLNTLLGFEGVPGKRSSGLTIVVVETDGCRYGLLVEELLGPEELVVKPLSFALRQTGLFAGATVLGNGTLALVLDVPGIAANAGVGPKERISRAQAERESREAGRLGREERPVVVYEIVRETPWGLQKERIAVPFATVERIEATGRDQIEFQGGQPMVRYRGQLVPVEDEGGVLHRRDPAELTLLICTRVEGETVRRIATVVDHVVAVSNEEIAAEEGQGTARQVSVLDDTVTLHRGRFKGAPRERSLEVA